MTDERNVGTQMPVFFGGINVYLQQKSALFRKTPRWIDQLFDAPLLLRWAASKAGMTRATDLAETTLSMLHGEDGHQAKELDRLTHWLEELRPDVVHLSNVLLAGMAHHIRETLRVPVTCTLQDEDIFVDVLPEPHRSEIWEVLAAKAQEIDGFIAVSEYFKAFMLERLRLTSDRIHVVYTGINVSDHGPAFAPPPVPTIGFLERRCFEKGLHLLVEAFILLKQRSHIPDLRLRVAGGHTADDEAYIAHVKDRLRQEHLLEDADFLPNLTREEKIRFLQETTVFSVPAVHHEAFGLYIIEALACGVPVVQPNEGAFSELINLTDGGVLYEPNTAEALAEALERLLLDPSEQRRLALDGRRAAIKAFRVERMAQQFSEVLESVG